MNIETLRSLQAPLKARYREDPSSANQTLEARGVLDADDVVCRVDSFLGAVPSGLHPSAGGDGTQACAASILLEALVGCLGVTLKAVATALEISIRGGTIAARGELDFRGTLGIDKTAPVGFKSIAVSFDLDTDAPQDRVNKLVELTERYCVVYRTLREPPPITLEQVKH
jgi:uncharacterized OsmC-like protein